MQSLWVMVILLLDSLCIKYYAVKVAMLSTKVQSQHILLYGKGLRDGRTRTPTYGLKNKEEICIIITALISVTGHVLKIDIYKALLPIPIPYSLCPQKGPQYLAVLEGGGWQYQGLP